MDKTCVSDGGMSFKRCRNTGIKREEHLKEVKDDGHLTATFEDLGEWLTAVIKLIGNNVDIDGLDEVDIMCAAEALEGETLYNQEVV